MSLTKANAQVARFLFNSASKTAGATRPYCAAAPLARADEVIKEGNIDKAHVIAAATRPEVVPRLWKSIEDATDRLREHQHRLADPICLAPTKFG